MDAPKHTSASRFGVIWIVANFFFLFFSSLSDEKLSEERPVSGPGTRQRQRAHPVPLSRDDASGLNLVCVESGQN